MISIANEFQFFSLSQILRWNLYSLYEEYIPAELNSNNEFEYKRTL
jgi:hypothetical protein